MSLEDVVFAERARCIHLKPFHNARRVEMMVAGKSVELCSILIWAETYTAFLEEKDKGQVLICPYDTDVRIRNPMPSNSI